MAFYLKPLLFRGRTAGEVCVSAMVDDQFIRLHEGLKPWSKFNSWLLVVSGAFVALIVGNIASLGPYLPKDSFPFTLLKISFICGFAAKVCEAYADFIMARIGTLGDKALQWMVEIEGHVDAFIKGSGEDPEEARKSITLEAAHAELQKRIPRICRAPLDKNSIQWRDKNFRSIFKSNLMMLILILAQLGCFASAVWIQIDLMEVQVAAAVEKASAASPAP